MNACVEYKSLLDASDQTDLRRRVIGTYPEAWLERYTGAGYGAIDLACRYCMDDHTVPLVWTNRLFRDAGADAMYQEAGSHGISAGVSVPLHDFVGDCAAGLGMARAPCPGLRSSTPVLPSAANTRS